MAKTFYDMMRDITKFGNSVALHSESDSITYRELDVESTRRGEALRHLGLEPGDRFAFLLPNGPEVVRLYLASARTGIIGVPLSHRLTDAEFVYQVRDSGARVVLYARRFSGLVNETRHAMDHVSHFIEVDSHGDWDRPLRPARSNLRVSPPKPDDPFCVMYTGGTTGTPKAAIQTQGGWACCLESTAERWGLRASDRHVCALPMSHAAWFTVAASLYTGGTAFLMEDWDSNRLLEFVEKERISTLNMIPTMLNDLLVAYEAHPRDVSSLRLLTVAGSPFSEAEYSRATEAFGDVIGNIYGLTEASGPVTFLLPDDVAAGKVTSVGRPGRHIELAILSDSGDEVEQGELGELGLSGPQVTPGYLGRPEESEAAFSGKWFLTGDIGKIDQDGYVYVVDRKKEMIKTGGYNVYPIEVEEVLYRFPEVVEAAVVGVPDDKWIEAVHAFVVLQSPDEGNIERILEHCRAELSNYKVPKSVRVMEELPRTGFGKYDKRRLRELHDISQSFSAEP